MQKRYYPLILLVLLLTACVSNGLQLMPLNYLVHTLNSSNSDVVNQPAVTKTQTKNVASFNQIDVQGPVSVTIHTGHKKPQVILSGDARDLEAINIRVINNTLHLISAKGYPGIGPVHVAIRTRFLNRLMAKNAHRIIGNGLHTSVLDLYLEHTGNVTLNGTIGLRVLDIKSDGLVRISKIYSRDLRLNLQGNPTVQLSGVARLTHLTLDGNASLNLSWIKTDNLTIRATKSPTIELAGAVNRLDVALWGNARFKGRYLRAQRSFVKTHDRSVAEISVAKHQSNLATGASNIYYYNLPDTRADFMAQDGSVLDMRPWNERDIKDYDRYNKQFP